MACTWCGNFMQVDQSTFTQLLPDIQATLQHGGNDVFLDTLAEVALDPRHTAVIFTTFEPLFTELCSRWMSKINAATALPTLAALARIIPFAPSQAAYAEEIACRQSIDALSEITKGDSTSLVNMATDMLVELLVTLLRLVSYDPRTFDCLISLPKMQVLISHGSACVKYLAAKLLCHRVGVSELTFDTIIEKALGSEAPVGVLGGQVINFQFWELWEEERFKALELSIKSSAEKRSTSNPDANYDNVHHLTPEDLMERTPSFAGQLLPRITITNVPGSMIAMTPTTMHNVSNVAAALNSGRPVLLTGLEGCGKTAIVTDIARRLGTLSNMLTLHLNDQTDAKLLVGMYASGPTPGSFEWKPGVLTTAVLEGRWVFIEDLDRAPSEILGLLLPLLERQELLVPNLGGWITASRSFKLVASIRSSLNSRNEEIGLTERGLGYRHWLKVKLQSYSEHDLREIIRAKYQLIRSFEPSIMKMYSAVSKQNAANGALNSVAHRPINVGALLRFCSRLCMQLEVAGLREPGNSIPDDLYDTIFLDAVDCFAGACDTVSQRDQLAQTIARELHLSPERMKFCLSTRLPNFSQRTGSPIMQFGRVSLNIRKPKENNRRNYRARFAETPQALHQLESLAVAVKMNEPCLLVGETGVGKTAIVQELANALNAPLTVVNLSQQSEINDLLGGLKPLNTRALVLPLKEFFEDLFDQTFSFSKNPGFLRSLDSAFRHENWSKILAHFKEAIKLSEDYFQRRNRKAQESSKRRKLHSQSQDHLHKSWEDFSARVDILKKHMSTEEQGVVFSFVEGNLVEAVRSGGWVLLDEINLASPDTLECLSDLLSHGVNEAPFLLLSESGNIQKIVAHPDFRLFGAMNPATDIGKKDLAPSIRSRFIEFYVHSADNDMASLLQIVEVYLKHSQNDDRVVIERVARLYADIRELENGNQLVDGAGQKPHFTLRTLTRALTFASDLSTSYGIQRSLIEGFSMCFLTVLNAESKALVAKIIDTHLMSVMKGGRNSLKQLPQRPNNGSQYTQFKQYWLQQGDLPPSEPQSYIITPYVEENLLNLVRATLNRRYPVLLQGPTSSGKTSMIEYLAARSGNRFVRINNHEHTDLQEYLGNYVSTPSGLIYQEGVLVKALREGHWIVLDELNLAPTDVLEALNRLLDDNRELVIPETQEIVRPHKNFMLFATQNPPGMYGGRKVLSRALLNRFLRLHFDDIPENELETILRERCPQVAPSFCTRIVAVYKRLAVLRQSNRLFEQRNSFATLRDLFRWAQRDADDRKQLAIDGFMLLGERVRNEQERLAVKAVIEETLKETIDIDNLYSTPSPGKHGPEDTGAIIWTKAAQRLATLIRSALRHNEPVLIIGDTGCGKTSICQAIANQDGTKLNIVNAHQNTETGDLIGSQRPARNRATLEKQLSVCLQEAFRGVDIESRPEVETVSKMLHRYDALTKTAQEDIPNNLRESIENLRSMTNVLFEWADGSLVQSMKLGEYYLLDEISLADDSVLERLNSVLEPSRSILLAEKGSIDSYISAKDGFQFLATMNPGGDYGKKELSPALENRFTAIWVPPLSKEEDIVPILEAKLDKPNRYFARQMVDFGQWFAETFHRSHSRIFIRDVLAWATLINVSKQNDHRLAFVQGAAMVYVDRLGATPSSSDSIIQDSLARQRKMCVQKLDQLVSVASEQLYGPPISVILGRHTIQIGEFSIPRSADAVLQKSFTFNASTTRSNASKILRALQLSKPILLEGSPGVGKTALVVALSEAVGAHLTRINLSDQTDLMDLFGGDVPLEDGLAGQFGWRDAPFLKAMQEGGWVLLDEMNLASQSVLEGLNACLDHRGEVFIPELGRTFLKHEDFKLFAAQNPHVQGGGRKGLPASFINRWTVVFADTLVTDDLVTVCSDLHSGFNPQHVRQAVNYVTQLQFLATAHNAAFEGSPWEFNLRDILRWFSLANDQDQLAGNATLSDYMHVLFEDRLRNARDLSRLKTLESSAVLSLSSLHSHYRNVDRDWYQCGFSLLQRSTLRSNCMNTWTPVLGSKIESAMTSVKQNWPLLLVGASGSGKTSLIHHLASWTGAKVVSLPLNADTDAYDLIGGYEQQDTQRKVVSLALKLERKVKRLLSSTLCENLWSERANTLLTSLEAISNATETKVARLDSIIQDLKATFPDEGFLPFLEDATQLIRQSTEDQRARFEWVDGMLVRAVQEGHWLVLDNANLCSSSVLDRLNALLEPNGSLTIHEHRSMDGSSRTIRPHRDFRIFLTMDPRYGELSRPMRNRCLELYIDTSGGVQPPGVMAHRADSSLFRLRSLHRVDWADVSEGHLYELLRVCLDHLSVEDHIQLESWGNEVGRGLLILSKKTRDMLQWLLEALRYFSQSNSQASMLMSPISRINTEKLDLGVRGISEFLRGQPVHPLVNSTLLTVPTNESERRYYRWLSTALDIAIDQRTSFYRLRSLREESLHSVQPRDQKLSVLQKSMLSKRDSQLARNPTAPIAEFLIGMTEVMSTWAEESLDATLADPLEFIVDNVCNMLQDLLELSNEVEMDSALFQSYLVQARSLGEQCKEFRGTIAIGEKLLSSLRVFDSGWGLKSGGSIDLLWPRLRPEVASNITQLRLMEEFLCLADRFNDLAWVCNMKLDHLGKICSSFYEAFQGIEYLNAHVRIEEVRQSFIQDETAHPYRLEQPRYPHFCLEFEGLRQSIHLNDPYLLTKSHILDIGAARNMRKLLQLQSPSLASRVLQGLASLTGIDTVEGKLMAVQGSLPSHILYGLYDVPQVSLGSLKSLRDELDLLGSQVAKLTATIDKPRLDSLNLSLALLHKEVWIAHTDSEQSQQLEKYSLSIQKLLPFLGQTGNESSIRAEPTIRFDRDHFYRVAKDFFTPSIECLINATTDREHEQILSSRAWVLFFNGLMLLFMPDKAYDPWLRVSTRRKQWSQRQSRLIAKVDALRWYQEQLTGETASLRLELAELKIREMEDQPPLPSIVRPQESRLQFLQAEFSNILRSIVHQIPETHWSPQERAALKRSLATAVDRLDGQFAEYNDIVMPVLNMLHGLKIGLQLADMKSQSCSQDQDDDRGEYPSILGFSFDSFHSTAELSSSSFQSRLHLLKFLRLQRISCGTIETSQILRIQSAFEVLYKLWQQHLKTAQEEYAVKTSLYRYAGSKDNIDEEDDLKELFPYVNDRVHEDNDSEKPTDPRQWAIRTSEVHEDIFSPSQAMLEPMIKLYKEITAETIRGTSPIRNRGHLEQRNGLTPAVLFAIDEHRRNLDSKTRDGNPFNFYKDSNVAETEKLCDLLWKLRSRFHSLHTVWPEYTPFKDILKLIHEILNIPHSEPMANLLHKVENLHLHVYGWQENASQEYSVGILYNDLTELIIAWRRLELSTWASLMDFEDEKCLEDARSWWFIAYQLIIQSSIELSDKEFLHPHIQGMVSELQNLLSTTSYGLFSHRLDLLYTFIQHASELAKVYPYMAMVAEAVTNTFNHFVRFRAIVKERVRVGRQTLENDMKDVVLLASWKDRNIHALRESARKSHYKLLKVIRKYRALLGQTIEAIMQEGAPLTIAPHTTHPKPITKTPMQPSAMGICKSALHIWETAPLRFREPRITASKLESLTQHSDTAGNVITVLSEFIQNVADSAASLQRETPATLTEDNKDFVKHLKSRKRRAFADVLKELRHFGFQFNPDTETLKAQRDIHKIFATCRTHSMFNASEPYFFGFVENMTAIRHAARNHAEDLSAAETSRSVGFLEGLLSTIISQRRSVANLLTSCDGFDEVLGVLNSLQIIENAEELTSAPRIASDPRLWYSKLAWIETLSDATRLTLETHEAMGGPESLTLRAEVASFKEKATRFREQIRSLPPLPDGLSSDIHEKVYEDVNEYLAHYKAMVQTWSKRLPEIAFAISGLLPWLNNDFKYIGTRPADFERHLKVATTTGVEGQEFLSDFFATLDSILLKIQNLRSSQAQLTNSTTEVAWYTKNEKINAAIRSSMNAESVTEKLKQLLAHMQLIKQPWIRPVGAFCSIQQPIFVGYARVMRTLANAGIDEHLSLCKVAHTLSTLFKTMVTRGFCSPQEQSEDKSTSAKIEEGTGLGEGEGAEDISKDVDDNEDLSELAKDRDKDEAKEDLETEKDAVDMADEELEGDTGDAEQENGEDDDKSQEGEADEAEDEVGSVDAERDDVIDEKLWDGKEEEQDSKKTEDAKGQSTEENKAQERETGEKENNADEQADLEGADESETMATEPREELDERTKEEDNLELPDDMELDKDARDTLDSDLEDAVDSQTDDRFGSDMEPEADEDGGASEDEAEGAPKSLSDSEDIDSQGGEDTTNSIMDTEPEADEKRDQSLAPQDHDNINGQPEPGDVEEAANQDAGLDPQTDEENKARTSHGEQGADLGAEAEVLNSDAEAGGQSKMQNHMDQRTGARDDNESVPEQPFQKFGDALEKWHRYNKEVRQAEDESWEPQTAPTSSNIQKQDLEHLPEDTAMADTQVLAPAPDEQTHALDQDALDAEEQWDHTSPVPYTEEQALQNPEIENALQRQVDESATPFDPLVSSAKDIVQGRWQPNETQLEDAELNDVDTGLSEVQLEVDDESPMRSLSEARQLWLHCEEVTRDLALILTEQLRLILSPTQAAKMRGDYSSGKRLNIKRIIPYIASQFRRDKIWLRRAKPSKRTYQILLAVDDSISMNQSGSGHLALEALALLSRSLSLLEVGQLCLLSFGKDVRVAHPFEMPFAPAEAGPLAFQHFGFNQAQTDVRLLVARSLELFRNARTMGLPGSQVAELWQLQLIISDGVCSDHEEIRRLVRQAMEERVMIVFVVVDALRSSGPSIVDLQKASFEPDANGNNRLRMTRYLDEFPFGYYVIVGDVRDLPHVLVMALRQWFVEVTRSD